MRDWICTGEEGGLGAEYCWVRRLLVMKYFIKYFSTSQ